MALNAEQAINQIKTFLQGLTLRQKVTLVLGAGAVAAALWGFVILLGKANYKTLYSGLTPTEAQTLTHRLAAKSIQFELSTDGTSVRVPASELDKARLEMAAQGMPQSGRLGFELFDKPNWSGSDFAEKVNYQRALEGELERTIQTIGEIAAARVHLVMPHESLFTEQERAAKASVVVKLRAGRLSDEAQEAITHLVASAVDNLKPEDVTLIDADGGVPIMAQGRSGTGASRQRADLEANLSQKLVATLEPIVGVGKARANVTVEYDLATSDSLQETYDPNATVVLTSQVSTESVGDKGSEGVPGTPSNVPGAQPTASAETASSSLGESQGLHTENKTFAVSKTVRHVMQPSGGVKRITAAVLIDDAAEVKQENDQKVETRRKRTPEEMKQIQELALAAIGLDLNRGDKLAVENLSFQTLPIEKPDLPSISERLVPVMEKWITLIRYLALLALFGLVYALVLRPIKNQIVTTFQELPKQLGGARKSPKALHGGSEGENNGDDALNAGTPLQRELAEAGSEVKQAVTLKRHLVEKVKKEPEAASRLIQNWVRQEIKL
jgi:flagellar M-ring protein FliF